MGTSWNLTETLQEPYRNLIRTSLEHHRKLVGILSELQRNLIGILWNFIRTSVELYGTSQKSYKSFMEP